jgi:hypothetical protein
MTTPTLYSFAYKKESPSKKIAARDSLYEYEVNFGLCFVHFGANKFAP